MSDLPLPSFLERIAQRKLNFALVVLQSASDGRPTIVIGISAGQPKLRVVKYVE